MARNTFYLGIQAFIVFLTSFLVKAESLKVLTISTSEMVSRLSTWTSTPTGIGGPRTRERSNMEYKRK